MLFMVQSGCKPADSMLSYNRCPTSATQHRHLWHNVKTDSSHFVDKILTYCTFKPQFVQFICEEISFYVTQYHHPPLHTLRCTLLKAVCYCDIVRGVYPQCHCLSVGFQVHRSMLCIPSSHLDVNTERSQISLLWPYFSKRPIFSDL